ncbi:MAG: prepilin-type N-terminal cleavage/methylation domain-containing protein [Bradymonadaceae bacterium]
MDERPHSSGFTLLEVLLALAILAMAVTALMGTVATSSQQAIYANKLTRVSQLARGKMIDLEYELMRDGLSDSVQHKSGDFADRGAPEIRWEAQIQPVEIPDSVKQQLLGKVNAQLFGGAKSKGALKGSAAFSSKLPALIGCIPRMINRIGKKVRRIVLIVKFDFAGRNQKLRLSHYIVDRTSAQFNLFQAAGKSASGAGAGTGSGGF